MKDAHIILAAPQKTAVKPLITEGGLVIGVDRGAVIALQEDIRLDVALGDFDSISAAEKRAIKAHAGEMKSFPAAKDDTDAEIAFAYALEQPEIENIYVYNWYGGRVDHLYSLLLVVLQKRFKKIIPKLKFVAQDNYISYYLPGAYEIKAKPAFKYLAFILLTEVKGLTLRHVKYQLTEADFDHPYALVSNEFLGDTAHFVFEAGIIGVVQSRDAAPESEISSSQNLTK